MGEDKVRLGDMYVNLFRIPPNWLAPNGNNRYMAPLRSAQIAFSSFIYLQNVKRNQGQRVNKRTGKDKDG